MKWGDSRRDLDPILAVWPEYEPLHGFWRMQELAVVPDGAPKWRERRVPDERGLVRMDRHASADAAFAAAKAANDRYATELLSLPMDEERRRSLQLRASKGLQAKERLHEEERLMLIEARRRHQNAPRPTAAELMMEATAEPFRASLAKVLHEFPYVTGARVGDLSDRAALGKGDDGVWRLLTNGSLHERGAKLIERSKIASGYGLNPTKHWGEVKATIRQMLLPRANQLLQLASVKRMLDEALARGDRVLVSNGIVFWYEESGLVGWQVKSTDSGETSDTTSLWVEGTIVSKNHGRLVILPFIKDNGERVKGHTKNAPKDGRAKPRHPSQYVEIPFKRLDGDLIIGLFGELPYE